MITEKQITELIETALDGTDRFPVEVAVKPGNRILVFIDSDTSVSIADCIKLSKFIESQLDRDVEDFELNVSSAGLDQPYKLLRQFSKNIGREISVQLNDKSKISGKLTAADADGIHVLETSKIKKEITETEHRISFNDIKEAKEIIKI